ncbi:MAG: HAMP domain-containing sensor histidine kinase [Gilvibacter sp.]
MSIALLGIIFVQAYWINNSFQTKKEQFTKDIRQVMIAVSQDIQNNELEQIYNAYLELQESTPQPNSTQISEIVYTRTDDANNEVLIFSNGITEQDYKLSSSFMDIDLDSVAFKRLVERQVKTTITRGLDGSETPIKSEVKSYKRLDDLERRLFSSTVLAISERIPIHQRVNKELIEKIIDKELEVKGLETPYHYGIYSNQLATKVRSTDFDMQDPSTFVVPLFVDENDKYKYELFVTFGESRKMIFSSIVGISILSLIFTAIIILAYWYAISQLIKQRQISQIKTDFINNMTHEFKTPIATINLALDALKNPKVANDEDFKKRYLGMIRDENKRMHAQVENVLRISRLENNTINLAKERVKLHDLIEDAMTSVSLMIEDKNGYIKTHFDASKSSILGNEFHLTNVLVNILDNAIKYSEEAPKIDIYTENAKNSIILRIKDQGIGMSKTAQKQIFEKFYREHTGNIHNVKGHGLGLAYVKRILDDHHADIYVESDRGKGSTFIVKFELIS